MIRWRPIARWQLSSLFSQIIILVVLAEHIRGQTRKTPFNGYTHASSSFSLHYLPRATRPNMETPKSQNETHQTWLPRGIAVPKQVLGLQRPTLSLHRRISSLCCQSHYRPPPIAQLQRLHEHRSSTDDRTRVPYERSAFTCAPAIRPRPIPVGTALAASTRDLWYRQNWRALR